MKIKIEKSENTIKKEQIKAKVDGLKNKKNVSNEELKDLLIIILEKLET